jgi:hypothetical protein
MDSVAVLDGLAQPFVYLDRSAHILVLITVNVCHKELPNNMFLTLDEADSLGEELQQKGQFEYAIGDRAFHV